MDRFDARTLGIQFPITPDRPVFSNPEQKDPAAQVAPSASPFAPQGTGRVDPASALARSLDFKPAVPQQQKDYYAGRPNVYGSHAGQPIRVLPKVRPTATPDRETMIKSLVSDPAVVNNADITGLKDEALASAYRWVDYVRKEGYKPVISSAFRTSATGGTGHKGGAAMDVGLYTLDGKELGDTKKEYEIVTRAARAAGFNTAINELDGGVNGYWSGPHVHLSMHEEGEHLHGDATPTNAARQDLRNATRKPGGLRGTARQIAMSVGIDPDWFEGMVDAESGFRMRGAGGKIITSSVGAQGLTQMMPETRDYVLKKYGLSREDFDNSAATQLRAGALYLKEHLEQQGDYASALAAYNAGAGGLEVMRTTGRGYRESVEYYKRIKKAVDGEDISYAEAEQAVIHGAGPKYNPNVHQASFQQDEANTSSFLSDFLTSTRQNALSDIKQGAQEFMQGITFGLSSFIPGMAPGNHWDNLRSAGGAGMMERMFDSKTGSWTDKALNLSLEIPWLLGSALGGEILTAGIAARGAGSIASNAGIKLAGEGAELTATTPMGKMGRALFEKSYTSLLQKNGGKIGTLGRMMFGKPASFFDNTFAHVTAFGMQNMAEGAVHNIQANASIEDIVKGGITDFMVGGAMGMAMGWGVPIISGLGAHLGINALGAARQFAPEAATGIGNQLFNAGVRGTVGGVLGAGLGAFNAEVSGGDSMEGAKKGMLLGAGGSIVAPEVFSAAMKSVSKETRASVYKAVDKFYNTLDDAQKSIYTSTVMEKAGIFKKELDEAQKEAVVTSMKANYQTSIADIDGHKATLEKQAASVLEQEAILTKQVENGRKAVDAIEASDSYVATYKDRYNSLLEEEAEVQGKLKESRQPQQGVDPKQAQQITAGIESRLKKVQEQISEITKDQPLMLEWARSNQALRGLESKLSDLKGMDAYATATQTIPEITKGLDHMKADMVKQLEWLDTGDFKEPMPEATAPWDLDEAMDPKIRESAERYIQGHVRSYVDRAFAGSHDPRVLEAVNRLKAQTFLDPKGTFNNKLDKVKDYLDASINEATNQVRERSPVIKASKKTREKYIEDSAIKWEDRRGKKGLGKNFVRASTLLEYLDTGGPLKSSWEVPEEVLNKIRRGEKVPLPELRYNAKTGRIEGYNTDVLRAAVAIGQEYVPIRSEKVGRKDIVAELKKFAKETSKARLEDLKAQRRNIDAMQTSLFRDQVSDGVDVGQAGMNVLKGNPYRITNESVLADIQRKFNMDAALREVGNNPIDQGSANIVEQAHTDFKSLSREDLEGLITSRFQEYDAMFDNQNSPSGMRQFVIDRAAKNMDPNSKSLASLYIENTGKPLVDMGDTLWWNVNGRMKAQAEGLLTEPEIIGHSLRSMVGMHGDQQMVAQYATHLEDKFIVEVEDAAAKVFASLAPSSPRDTQKMLGAFNKVLGTSYDDAAKLTKDDIGAAITYAMDDNEKLGQLLRDVPELVPALSTFMKHQAQWEPVISRSPTLRGFMRPAYALHKYKDMATFVATHAADNDFSRRVTELMTENERRYATFGDARKAHNEAREALATANITPKEFLALDLNGKIRRLTGMTKKTLADKNALPDAVRKATLARVETLTADLLVGNPVTDPAALMAAKVRMTVQADSMRRFMAGLTHFETEIPDAPGNYAQLMTIGDPKAPKSSPAAGYIRVSDIPGWGGVKMENPRGDVVDANHLWVHPKVDTFLRKYAHSSGTLAEQNWNTFMGLLRTSTLFGTPVPHALNTLSNNLAEFVMAPARAIGMIGAGKKLAQDGIDGLSGDFMQLYAMKAGVNTKVMRTTTRLIAQDINKYLGADAESIFGEAVGKGKTADFLAAMDPMDEAAGIAAKTRLGPVGKAGATFLGSLPKVDYVVNRKMLFDVIEQSQIGGFFYRTASYLEELRKADPSIMDLPKKEQLEMAQQLAAERVNEVAGALPYMYTQDATRKLIYNTVLTPSWFLAKGRMFVQALDHSLGLLGGNVGRGLQKVGGKGVGIDTLASLGENTIASTIKGQPMTRYGHLDPRVRSLYAKKIAGTVAAGLAAYIGGTQVASYMVNGHSTFANPDPNKWLHLKVGDHYYNNPMFGFFRDFAKSLTGTAMGQGIEPWMDTITRQFLPTLRAGVEVVQNQDGFTGRAIRRPGAGVAEGTVSSMNYIMKETVNIGDLLGIDESKGGNVSSIGQIYQTLGVNGDPVNRLNGREWLLRQFGVWESDYNAPARIAGKGGASLKWHQTQLSEEVEQYLQAAKEATDPEKSQRYARRAYTLALQEGIEMKDADLRPYVPGGRLRMSTESLTNLVAKVQNPSAYAISGEGKPNSPVLNYLLMQLQKERMLQEKEGWAYLIQRQQRR